VVEISVNATSFLDCAGAMAITKICPYAKDKLQSMLLLEYNDKNTTIKCTHVFLNKITIWWWAWPVGRIFLGFIFMPQVYN
jgi:hypothetical protein